MRDFRKYEIWQMSHSFTLKIYAVTKNFPKEEIFNLTSQLRRAAVSIPTNISEGCGRNSDREFNHFLNIALGSTSETKYLLILAHELNYLSSESFSEMNKEVNNIKSKIFKLKEN
ncbi:four helix bundle protein [Flavobacterium sp. MAH-1]|uniref:Four helix bundle protein n=1 Tax=Flavobacterium agri TaxID=2743471 RepID=A0A7Y8Y390_9FLAO|nr:four helix bundle protein [Flavobacterium agri]NUY81765.1 four helix bundle protein [Flavobacterium agri]NYA71789.1 four helix bundle protein [Flavobacterium agri]